MKKLRYNKPKRLGVSRKDIYGLKPNLKGKESGLFIDRPIQVYRCWFEYLKLCLEMEDLGLSLEKMERVKFDEKKGLGYTKYKVKELKNVQIRFRTLEEKTRTWNVKVDRNKYEGWELDKVLTQSFDNWWNPHSHLFENKKTIEIKSPDKWVKKPYYRYIRVDTRKRYQDTRSEFDEIMSDVKGKEKKKELKTSTSQFTVIGKPRVDSLVVNRNIMIRFKNWELDKKGKSRKQIVDEIMDKEHGRMFGNTDIGRRLRLTYPILIGVCEGDFVREIKLEDVGKLI